MRTTVQKLLSTLLVSMRLPRCHSIIPACVIALIVLFTQSAGAALILNVVETGGDNEATDTIVAKWSGVTYNATIADEPVIGIAVGTPYTVSPFGNGAPCYVDRAHRYTNADPAAIPGYLLGGEYIMNGNDNRDNATMTMDVTVAAPVRVYLLIDNRLSDASDANPPTFDATHMQWVVDEGWVAVKTGANRTGDISLPDEVGIDEGADGTINNHFSVYAKVFPAGTFQLKQADNTGQNMYGAVVTPGPRVVPSFLWTVGLDDGGWPVGNGGGANASFVQENGVINPLPGSPTSPEVDQQADNDYYFAGTYTTVIPGNGSYVPVGTVAVNEEAAERAFAAADNDLRYHFNLPTSLTPLDLLSVTFDANNLHDGNVDTRYGVEIYFNGVKVQDQIVIRPPQLDVDYTTKLFTLASVNAQTGPGADNIVSLRGINYNADGGGNWMGIDYVQLNATEGLAPGYLQKVRFDNIVSNSVALSDLLSHPKYINDQFDSTCLRTDFSANDADECDNCGLAVRGYFIPKISGPHTFYFCSDDGGGLFLSTDETPANKRLIAVEPVWSARKTYTGEASGGSRMTTPSPSGGPQANISAPIYLVAGNRYYIEGAVKEAGGGDNIDVAVQGPGDPAVVNGVRGISGDRIAAKVDLTGSSLVITQSPANARVPEGGEASFTVAAEGSSPLCGGATLYQWQRKGSTDTDYTDIAGANSATYSFGPVRPEDNASSYRCTVRVPGISKTSAAANLEVLGRECLRVVSASGVGDFKHVKVLFSTFINTNDVATTDPFSYEVTGPGGPLSVSLVTVNSDGKSVTLTTDPQAADTDYVVAVTGVQNIVGSLVCDPPNNQVTFSLVFTPGFALKEYFQTWTAGATSVDALIASPPPPTISCFVNLWAMNTSDEYENYGGKISGYFVPVASGPHVFYFASDDYGRLFLSTDADPANKAEICREPVWSGRRTFVGEAGGGGRVGTASASGGPQANISGTINLVAGQKYYMESWFTEGGGGDNMDVAVQGPGEPAPVNGGSSITTANIGAYITPPVGASATITQHPLDAAGLENAFTTFTAAGTASSPLCGPASTYQWFRNGVPIIGAISPTLTYGPLTVADDGARFKMRVAAVGVSADSAEAVLTINRDVAPPLVLSVVGGPLPSNVSIKFNELLKQSSAEDTFNFAILGAVPPIGVSSATLKADGSNVVLTLDADLTAGRSYSVTINFVEDLAGNVIAPTTLSFSLPTSFGYAAAVLADGPIAYWRFNDTPPTAVNLGTLGAAANGTYNGGATTGSEALRPPAFPGLEAGNTALQCNGSDAFVGTAISLMNSRPAFTISGWMRRNADQADRTGLWGQNDIVEFGYINNNTIELWTDNGLHQSPDPTVNPIPNGQWAHFTVVSEGSPGNAYLYTNGVLASTRTHTLPVDNAFFFNIGGGGVFDGTGNFFNGQIDEVAVYGKALTAAQIAAQYQAAFLTPGFGFDDCATPAGTVLYGNVPPNGTIADDGTGHNCVLHLTDAGQASAFGAFLISNSLGSANIDHLNVKWRSLIGGGQAGGADGYSFNWAPELPNPPTYGNPGEEGAGTGLSFNVDTWDNGGGDLPGIEIKYQGAQVAFHQLGKDTAIAPDTTYLRKSAFVNAEINVDVNGLATFTYDGVTITANLPGWGGIAGANYLFGARTGGANDNMWIDDIIITATAASTTPSSVTITLQPVDQTFVVNPPNPGGATLLDQNFTSGDGGFVASGAPAAFTGAFAYDATAGSWQANAADPDIGTPYTSLLHSPTLTIGASGHAVLTMDHRWSVEAPGDPNHWDGTQLRMSINGGPFVAVPASAFTQGGYNGTVLAGSASLLHGQAAWTENSVGHETGSFITSVADLGTLNAGDTVQLEFLYGADTNTKGNLLPSWEITSVKVDDGIPPSSVTFTTAATAIVPGNPNPPLSYQWSRDGNPIPGANGASYTFVPVIGDNGAKFQCVASTTGASATTREATLTVIQGATPPTVAITSPADGTTAEACSTAIICATAHASGGASIAQVVFMANGSAIGLAAGGATNTTYCVSVPNAPAGVYVLTAIATDSNGNSTTSAPVNVTVADRTRPVVTCPANISVNSPNGVDCVVTYTATASDSCGSASVACVPASGSTFPIGTTTVTCTATDGGSNTASCTFTVTCIGNLPPTAVISSEQLIDLKPEYDVPVLLSCNWWNACLVADGWTSSDPEGGDLTYLWSLGNDPVPFGAGPVVTNCLEVGRHTIILTVTDPTGLQGTDTKTIEVVTAPLAIEILIEQINESSKSGIVLSRKTKRELTETLRVALGFAGNEKLRETQKALDAFEKKVRSQVAPTEPEAATAWIRWSQSVSEGMEKCIKPPRKNKDHDDSKKDDDGKKR